MGNVDDAARQRIADPDVRRLAECSHQLRATYPDDEDVWRESPFRWINGRPSRQIGKIGEQLVSAWCESLGMRVAPSGDAEADRVVQGHRVEIKYSSLWAEGQYRFQQIRDQDYEILICLGLSPFDAHCWVFPKRAFFPMRERPCLRPQHGGRKGRDTSWLIVPMDKPCPWLHEYGGSLARAAEVLRRLVGYGGE